MNMAELKEKNPELYAQVIAEGKKEANTPSAEEVVSKAKEDGAEAERKRLEGINSIKETEDNKELIAAALKDPKQNKETVSALILEAQNKKEEKDNKNNDGKDVADQANKLENGQSTEENDEDTQERGVLAKAMAKGMNTRAGTKEKVAA